ncbi:MAG: YggS family pyridoxal phosphate-dependent enzyme [Rhizobacter sp.]|nr:YggS family pyridoxal phosphate-dependent enzyme [Bacteriovorax sp.]
MSNELAIRLRDLKAELNHATLVAVSKYSPVEDVIEAYSYGQIDFGENRVSELKAKSETFEANKLSNVRWHFIGGLQTNKVKELLKIPNLWGIHSVGSKKIVEELIKREHEFDGPELKLFFQLNTSHEEEKSGFETIEELKKSIDLINSLKNSKLKVFGLMTMGAIRTEDFVASAIMSFRELKNSREKLEMKDLKLSMGMSQDYKIALSEGADFIRVGSLIFK